MKLSALGKCLLGGLDDDRRDLVGIAIGSRAPVFKTAFPAVLDGGHRDPDRGPTIGHTVAKLVDRLSLVQTGEALNILFARNSKYITPEIALSVIGLTG